MRHLIKESVELEMGKQEPIQDSATVTINLVEADIYALKIRFNTLNMKVKSNIHKYLSDADRTSFKNLQFQLTHPRGSFAKLEHELTGLTNKFESGGGVDIYGFTSSHDDELIQWFKDRNGKLKCFLMQWPCFIQLVLHITLPKIP